MATTEKPPQEFFDDIAKYQDKVSAILFDIERTKKANDILSELWNKYPEISISLIYPYLQYEKTWEEDSVDSLIEAKTQVFNQMKNALCFDKELGNRIVTELNLCIDLFYSPLSAEKKRGMVGKLHDFNKSVTNPQPQKVDTDKYLFDQVVLNQHIKEIREQKTLHEQNMEVMRLNHEQSMELEALRNRRAFDSIAMADLEAILASEDTEGVIVTKRLSAIAWCRQQAVLLPSSAATLLNVGGGIGIENTANYLFKTFFPDLATSADYY